MAALSDIPSIGSIHVLPRLQAEPVTRLPNGIQQFPAVASRVKYSLRALWLAIRLRPGIVYCGHAFMAPLAVRVARLAGARLLLHVHGLEVWEPLPLSTRRALASSDLILCVSNHTAAKVVGVTGADPKRCKVIFNTFDDRFRPGDRILARNRFGLSSEAMVLSTVSRLDPRQRHKGHDRVIPLLKSLSEDFPQLVYLIAGTGEDRARLEAMASDTGAGDIVRFLGFVADEDLPDLYRASDLYVMPSHGEGFGIAFVEAMACGTPALGLNVGGAGCALRDGDLGRAVSEEAFPAALRAALSAPPTNRAELAALTRAMFGRTAFAVSLAAATAPLRT